jgi:hypothetical protein
VIPESVVPGRIVTGPVTAWLNETVASVAEPTKTVTNPVASNRVDPACVGADRAKLATRPAARLRKKADLRIAKVS